MVVSVVRTTARAEIGAVTSRGRVVKLNVLDLPTIPASANDPNLQGGVPLSEVLSLEAGERVLALSTLPGDGPGLALGTRQGIVKRVNPEVLSRTAGEVIGLKDGDEVVGAVELTTGRETLCFITSDAQLLHYAADAVRPGPVRRRHRRGPGHDRRARRVVRRGQARARRLVRIGLKLAITSRAKPTKIA